MVLVTPRPLYLFVSEISSPPHSSYPSCPAWSNFYMHCIWSSIDLALFLSSSLSFLLLSLWHMICCDVAISLSSLPLDYSFHLLFSVHKGYWQPISPHSSTWSPEPQILVFSTWLWAVLRQLNLRHSQWTSALMNKACHF